MIEMTIDNKLGGVWDITVLVSGATWKTSRSGSAGSLDFTLVKSDYPDTSFSIQNGDIVKVWKNGQNVFYGYVFSVTDDPETVKIKAYDQIRYLLYSDTFVFENSKASEVVEKIAQKFKLRTGTIEDTQYVIPSMMEDGKKLLDTINKAFTLTLVNSGLNFVLFDDFGALSVRNVESLLLDFYIGEGSLLTGYETKKSIDEDTYNRIVLYQDNKTTKKRELHVEQNSVHMAKWGILQLYQSVDENMNVAQIREMLTTLSTLKIRETRSLKIEAIGDIRVRAGCYLRVLIPEQNVNQPFLVDECTHTFNGADHTMSLEMRLYA